MVIELNKIRKKKHLNYFSVLLIKAILRQLVILIFAISMVKELVEGEKKKFDHHCCTIKIYGRMTVA